MRSVAIALGCCAAIGTQGAVGTQRPQPFRAAVDAVRVDVLVTDRNRPVAGLTAADFILLDNGVPQQIEAIHVEDVPVSMLLALDASSSVDESPLMDLKEAALGGAGDTGQRRQGGAAHLLGGTDASGGLEQRSESGDAGDRRHESGRRHIPL